MAGADMTPDQLRAALAASQQQVADMAAAQEEFLRVVSHDLRAPLRHITSYGKLVREVLGDLPADTLPDRGRTALVATMPVPASPSGGHIRMPAAIRPAEGSALRPIRPTAQPADKR